MSRPTRGPVASTTATTETFSSTATYSSPDELEATTTPQPDEYTENTVLVIVIVPLVIGKWSIIVMCNNIQFKLYNGMTWQI